MRSSCAIGHGAAGRSRRWLGAITDDSFHVIGNVGGALLIHTDKDAPKSRIVRIDPSEPDEKDWQTVVAERQEPLQRASTAGGKLFAVYMHDVTARVRVHGLDGVFEHDLALPGPGTVDGFIGERSAASAFFTFTSFVQPTADGVNGFVMAPLAWTPWART